MKRNLHYRFLLTIIPCLVFSLVLVSCLSKNRRTIIQEKKFVDVLVDIHLADAIATERSANQTHKYLIDSSSLYNSVFNKHDITRAMFDSTMRYYVLRPDDFQKVYNKVTARLKLMEEEVTVELEAIKAKEEELVWHDTAKYNFPPLRTNPVEINVPITGKGVYTVSATVTIYPDDSSVNPRMNIYFYFDNNTPQGNRNSFAETKYTQRNGQSRTYSVSKRLIDTQFTHIKGSFANYSNVDTLFRRHMVISDIKITRKLEE